MEFAEIPDQAEWNDDVPYASAFEDNDMEAQNNPFYDDTEQVVLRQRFLVHKARATNMSSSQP